MSPRNVRILLLVLLALEAALLLLGPQARDHLPAIQSALAAKGKPEWWDDAAMGIRYAAWINLALLILLLLTTRHWTRPLSKSRISNLQSQISNPTWFWPLVILAMLTCLGLRLPLASKSLWWDEAWVVQQVSHGKWRPDSQQTDHFKFMAHDWKRCAFYYQKPTNHVPMSLAQKASFNVWRMLTGSPRSEFSDLAARVPALIASCAAVMLLALLLHSWGRPGAGVFAGFLLAVHPWYIRYGVDARAYALVVPLCIGGMLAITRLVRTRGERTAPWVCWGAVQFVWLWVYPNALLDVAALNFVALLFLVRHLPERRDRLTAFLRLAATCLFSAMLLIQVFLPNLMQARRWVGQESDAHLLDAPLLATTISCVLTGLDAGTPQPGVEFAGIPQIDPATVRDITIALVILLLLMTSDLMPDFVRHLRGRGPPREWHIHRSLPLTIILSTATFMLVTRVIGTYFYPRFIIAVLPCLIAVLVLPLGKSPGIRWVSHLILGGAFLWFVWPAWVMLTTRPIAPLHDAASFVQQEAAKLDTPPLVACYGLGREVMPVYIPQSLAVEDAPGLGRLIEQAKAERRALLVIQGYNFFNRALLGSGFTLLDDRALFEEVKAFPGTDPEFYFRVFRLK